MPSPIRSVLPLLCFSLLAPPLAHAAPPRPKEARAGKPSAAAPGPDVLVRSAPFAVGAADLLTLRGEKTPTGLDVEVLLDDVASRFEADGRRTTEYRMVYRVLTDDGVEQWASVGADYHPWYQNKPVVRGRVVTPDGVVHTLDEKTLVDAASDDSGDGNLYNDRRNVSAPLPAVRVGSVVETLVALSEHKPFYAAGSLDRLGVYTNTYAALTRVSVSAPESLHLSYGVRGSRTKPSVERANGRIAVTLEERNLRPYRKWPSPTEPGVAVVPELEFATAKGWGDVAQSYAKSVDAALVGFDAAPIVKEVVGAETAPDEKLQKLLAYLHREVRYTGLELGERSILPSSPRETLERHYGDCKDKATLLVALLRASGFDAHVALLRTGPGLDVPENLAGMGLFDHAIVHVGGKEPLFLDATAEHAGPHDLPYMDQDRLALIAAPGTRGLVRTPRTRAAQSISQEDVHVTFSELGHATLVERTTGRGTLEAELRGSFDEGDDQLREQFKKYVNGRYGATLTASHAEAVHDLTRPFELTIEAKEAENLETYDNGGFAPVVASNLYTNLPQTLYETPKELRSKQEEEADAPDPRFLEPPSLPVYVPRAHTQRVNYHLALPEGFRWHTLPDPLSLDAGGITATRRVRSENDRSVTVEFELRTDAQRVTPDELEKVRRMLHDFDEQSGASIRFVNAAQAALEEDDLAGALRIHRELLAKYPKSVPVRSRYAQGLLQAGFGAAARRVGEQLVKDFPNSARAHWTLGYIMLYDEVGRDSYPGADFARAEKSLRTALQKDPEDEHYYTSLAAVLTNLAFDSRPVDRKRMDEVGTLYETLRTKFKNHDSDDELLRNYLWREKYNDAVHLAEEMQSGAELNELWVASVAGREGAQAARRKAEQLAGGDGRTLIVKAATLFLMMGRHPLARELLKLPGVGEQAQGVSMLLQQVADRASCEAKLAPAARTVVDFYRSFLYAPVRLQDVDAELKKLPAARIDRRSLADGADAFSHNLRAKARAVSMLTLPLIGDSLACARRWEVEEKSGAVRVKSATPGAIAGEEPDTFFVRTEKTGLVLVAQRQKGRTVGYSRAMLAALEDKKLDEARQWAAWAWTEIEPYGGHKERYTFADAAKALWPQDVKQATADELRVLGAFLAGGDDVEQRELKLLEAEHKRAAKDGARSRAIALALSWHYWKPETAERGAKLLAQLHAEFPEDKELWRRYMNALYTARKDADLTRELAAYDAKEHDNPYTSEKRNAMDRRAGRYDEAVRRTEARLGEHQASRNELNNVAWDALFVGGDLGRATKLAEASCEPEGEASASALHTLATLYAERGDLGKARAKLLTAMRKRGDDAVSEAEWYTWGRIAEGAGLLEAARDAYERVKKPEYPSDTPTYDLAQGRLKRLPR